MDYDIYLEIRRIGVDGCNARSHWQWFRFGHYIEVGIEVVQYTRHDSVPGFLRVDGLERNGEMYHSTRDGTAPECPDVLNTCSAPGGIVHTAVLQIDRGSTGGFNAVRPVHVVGAVSTVVEGNTGEVFKDTVVGTERFVCPLVTARRIGDVN